MPGKSAKLRPIRAKLIYNTQSGQMTGTPHPLTDVIAEMQKQAILPEVHVIQPDSQVDQVVKTALRAGIQLIVVAGGDGTVENAIGPLVGSEGTLGIIPTGTRNNVAFNLGIPGDIPGAVALLRGGIRRRIDVGQLRCGRQRHWFLEAASFGLVSDMFPFADQLQHGDVTQIAGLLGTFVASLPSTLRLSLDGRSLSETNTFLALVTNMSTIGPHVQFSKRVSCLDGRLDLFLFPDMDKLGLLIAYAGRAVDNPQEDPLIKHLRAREITVEATPAMPILADSHPAGEGRAAISVLPAALGVMTGPAMIGARGGRTRPAANSA